MAETIRVSEEFRTVLEAHRRKNETIEETLRRLIGGPSPEALATVVDGDDTEELRAVLEQRRADGRDRRADVRNQFE